jgi:hypothetical protein
MNENEVKKNHPQLQVHGRTLMRAWGEVPLVRRRRYRQVVLHHSTTSLVIIPCPPPPCYYLHLMSCNAAKSRHIEQKVPTRVANVRAVKDGRKRVGKKKRTDLELARALAYGPCSCRKRPKQPAGSCSSRSASVFTGQD